MLVAFVLVVIVTDWRWHRIPNQVTYPTMFVGVGLGVVEGVPGTLFETGALAHLAGLVAAFAVCFPLLQTRLLLAGDVKLLMAVGAMKGPVFLFYAALYGSLVGGLLALVLLLFRRLIPPRSDEPTPLAFLTDRFPPKVRQALRSSIPYGVALGIGALIALTLAP